MHLLELYMYIMLCTYLSSICTEWYALTWNIYVQNVMHLLELYMYRMVCTYLSSICTEYYALTWVLFVQNVVCTYLSSICTECYALTWVLYVHNVTHWLELYMYRMHLLEFTGIACFNFTSFLEKVCISL